MQILLDALHVVSKHTAIIVSQHVLIQCLVEASVRPYMLSKHGFVYVFWKYPSNHHLRMPENVTIKGSS